MGRREGGQEKAEMPEMNVRGRAGRRQRVPIGSGHLVKSGCWRWR